MWDLVPWPGIEPGSPALEVQSPIHCTTREVPENLFLCNRFCAMCWDRAVAKIMCVCSHGACIPEEGREKKKFPRNEWSYTHPSPQPLSSRTRHHHSILFSDWLCGCGNLMVKCPNTACVTASPPASPSTVPPWVPILAGFSPSFPSPLAPCLLCELSQCLPPPSHHFLWSYDEVHAPRCFLLELTLK